MKRIWPWLLVLAISGCVTRAEMETTATIDAAQVRQTVIGFGGDTAPWHMPGLTKAERQVLLEFAFKEMGLNLVRGNVAYHEGATAQDFWGRNDNADPWNIEWSAFNFCSQPGRICNDEWATLLPFLRRMGVNGAYWGLIQGPRWNGFDGASTFNEDEMVENQVAAFLYFRKTHGIGVTWLAPFSEPSGGGIDWRITPDQAVNVVKKLGPRLEAHGFSEIKMIIPDCTGVGSSIAYAKAILQNPEARRYVGAIGYHIYDTSDGGEQPDDAWIASRRQIRDLAASYGLPVRMTEFCCLRGLLKRANHIYNELEYADSETYVPQHVIGQSESSPEDIVFYTKDETGRLAAWGPTRDTGVATGHFSRYARPGFRRLVATSSHPGVRLQAFVDDGQRHLAVVLINNTATRMAVRAAISGGVTLAGPLRGDQSIEGERSFWVPTGDLTPSGPTTFSLTVPGRSVTSLEAVLGSSRRPGPRRQEERKVR